MSLTLPSTKNMLVFDCCEEFLEHIYNFHFLQSQKISQIILA